MGYLENRECIVKYGAGRSEAIRLSCNVMQILVLEPALWNGILEFIKYSTWLRNGLNMCTSKLL